tara:strand:- start:1709 stop:1870 length:162 start_codon:yes stop_codon:yes gene_type:complete
MRKDKQEDGAEKIAAVWLCQPAGKKSSQIRQETRDARRDDKTQASLLFSIFPL